MNQPSNEPVNPDSDVSALECAIRQAAGEYGERAFAMSLLEPSEQSQRKAA